MQNLIIIGIITKELEYRMTEQGNSLVKVTVRVPSQRKDEQGRRVSDFFECSAWGKTALFINEYFRKDMQIAIQASLHNHRYVKDGVTVYTYNILINKADFVPSIREI